MRMVIIQWDDIAVPSGARDYHRFVREAMSYEQRAFETMEEYYSGPKAQSEFDRLRRQSMDYWNSKDEALLKAMRVAPK